MTDAERLAVLLDSEPYWTALALKTQGSRFYRALGDALEAADAVNRRLLYQTWLGAFWDFHARGLRLRAGEEPPAPG